VDELWRCGAGELAGMIAAGVVSSREVVSAHLARIDEVNPAVNAVVRVLTDDALAAADAVDRARAAGDPLGPLAGVPVTVKENIDLAGTPTTHGLTDLAEAIATVDAPVVERLRAAGAIPLARTNLPDMGLRIHTDSGLHGRTRNPWHPDRTAGGSSGGEAVALATGMSPLGLGNDLGGSLRNPASCCGIASIKPTSGLVPHATSIPAEDDPPAFAHLAVQGPMARRIADVRLGLSILAGPHPRDPFSVPVPVDQGPLGRPLRVAVLAEPPGGTTHPEVASRVRAAAEALAAAGAEVSEQIPPRYEEVIEVWAALVLVDVATLLPLFDPLLSADARAFITVPLANRPPPELGAYVQAWMQRQSLARSWGHFFESVDVVLSPTWTQLPFEAGWDVASPENIEATLELFRPVLPANALGLPSACAPAGLVDGLPVGVLLTGAPWRDGVCLDAAEVVEAALAPDVPIDPFTA
jgi:amidase